MAMFPMDRNVYPQASNHAAEDLFLLFQISLVNQSLMETIIGVLCMAYTSPGVDCYLKLPYSTILYIINALYGIINLQLPCKNGEIKIGKTVNYFSLAFISQFKLLVGKGKHYALMMIISK